MCGRHLAAFAAARGAAANAAGRTTARPLARPTPLEVLAAPVHEVIEKRTSLHDLHVAAGARMGWSGSWLRPFAYEGFEEEYSAVRERVSVMDVGTLAKFLVTGPDATDLVDATFPTRIDDLEPGRARYLLALDEAGYVFDDGLLCSLGEEGWYLTSTSGGADRMEAWLRDRADRLGFRAHVVDLTAERSAILVTGPRARDLLAGLTDDPIDGEAFPHMGVRELTVAGVPCGAIRAGFVGEVAFELHHPRSRGPELWRAIAEAGAPLGLSPHGLDTLEVLRLEKGHVYVGRTPCPTTRRRSSGSSGPCDRASVSRGRARSSAWPSVRSSGSWSGSSSTEAGPSSGAFHCRRAIGSGQGDLGRSEPGLDRTIGLGWIRREPEATFPEVLRAGRVVARVVPTPFYDPEGDRLRG